MQTQHSLSTHGGGEMSPDWHVHAIRYGGDILPDLNGFSCTQLSPMDFERFIVRPLQRAWCTLLRVWFEL